MKKISVGIDISKKTLDVSIYSGSGGQPWMKTTNSEDGFIKILTWVEKQGFNPLEVMFVMEHTGHYGYALAAFLDVHDMSYTFVAGLEVKHHFPLNRVKNDKNDAKRIAQYYYEVQERPEFTVQTIKASEIYALSLLLSERNMYVKQRAHLKTQLAEKQEYSSQNREPRLKEIEQLYNKQIRDVEREIKQLVEQCPEIKRNYELIIGVVGIGLITAVTIIVATASFTRSKNARSFANHICVAPCDKSSGTSVLKGVHTSNIGRKDIKSLLSRGVLLAIKYDMGIKAYYERKKAEGKHYYCIANAIMFKMICRVFAVVKRGTPYVETYGYMK
ncbi:MAG: IS110 family transposase [Muribaculaceae bacterium]